VNSDAELRNSRSDASLASLRREYTLAALNKAELAPDPIAQFQKWFREALHAQLPEPSAMTLATANKLAEPSARIVLLKGVDERGFIFYTNYGSQKAAELIENPPAALVFHWPELERQVRISGKTNQLSRDESEDYFRTRPRASRLAAWASKQSQVVGSRGELEEKFAEVDRCYPGESIPLPCDWGGFVVAPTQLEFWQGRPSRLHDRFRYTKQAAGLWIIERLAP
jgi:pyridoxamine 5'-phosphate oxidase